MSALGQAITARYPAFSHALYRRYWLASLASVGATQLITLGQGWLIFELTASVKYLGYLGAAAAAPNILITLIYPVCHYSAEQRNENVGRSSGRPGR